MLDLCAKSKKELVEESRELCLKLFPERKNSVGNCLFSTLCFLLTMHKRHKDCRTIIQAGTMLWRFASDEVKHCTHFGYEYSSGSRVSKILIKSGCLPEIHIWAAIPETQEVVDLETKNFPISCKQMIGYDWQTELPPDYLWTNDVPKAAYYEPNMQAIQYVDGLMVEIMKTLKGKR